MSNQITNYGVKDIKTLEGIELTKQDAQDAINRLVKFFQKYKGEFFGLDEDEYVEKDRKARKEYEKLKNDAEERARVEGKKSQKAETLRVGIFTISTSLG